MTFDWYPEERKHKRVTLCGANNCKDVTCNDVVNSLMGMGLSEWEYYMGKVFTESIANACQKGEDTADVTKMFCCDLVGIDDVVGKFIKSQKEVVAFLMEKLFETVSETEEKLTVSIKPGVLTSCS